MGRSIGATGIWAAALVVGLSSLGCDEGSAERLGPAELLYSESRLRIEGEPADALVTIGGEVAVTVLHFNDRLQEFAVEDRGQDVATARRQVLDQMINYQLIVREGRRRHPEMAGPAPEKGAYFTQRLLAQTVIRESVTNPDLVGDDEAREYLDRNRDTLGQLIENTPLEPDQLILAKISLLDARWREQLASWRVEHDIRVFEERLKDTAES